ncbi:MAG: DUF4870 domain-containing protein [Planctomycetes bacterium]|nr:DUF4870 domain-containing protein [Planctomycetota bacterium]
MPTGSLTNDEKLWATFAHLSALAILLQVPVGNVIGPLVIWLIKRNESGFVDAHGKESLNFQISITLYLLVMIAIGAITCVLLPIVVVLGLAIEVAAAVFVIMAAMKANNGEMYEYPLTIRLIK